MPPREDWSPAHDAALLRAMTALLLQNRCALYATPGLEGVADHGGERINKKIQQYAKRMAGDGEVVADELAKLRGAPRSPAKTKTKAMTEEGEGKEEGVKKENGKGAVKSEREEEGGEEASARAELEWDATLGTR